ncbi:hypothetical protein C8A03DRAFT_42391 [Achaetomium macrosporum]|uniref:DUF2406 domain-containing protein n=1 Tax=Achaetomium macrosporum TaxID=79813 RepID=A0AAN7CET7_9PEZI|nr:hypothetical protein C8A03DRAFT_42391 [Achaetomium macrosporum]
MAVPDNHVSPASPYQLHQEPPQHTPQVQSAQQRPTHKQRKSRAFSFRSDKSHKSQGSGSHKIDLHETSAEKEAKRLHSKADPTLAMQEAEPAEVAATVKSSLAPLRAIQHKDAYGNPIADPDLSNPTRSRWERPLDTIRSFEAAIDGGYSNRRSIIRTETDGPTWGSSRRASYYGGHGAGGRFTHDSYYGSRPPSMYANRADGSQQDLRSGAMGQRDTYYDYQPGPSAPNGRRGWPRMSSEPQYGSASRQQNPQDYPVPSNHRSYETVTTASGSGSLGEPAGYQTDPTSSDNGSIDRLQSVPRRQPEPVNDYGIGFSQSPSSYQPPSFPVGMQGPSVNGGGGAVNYGVAAPPVPQKESAPALRKAMMAGPVQQQQQQQQQQRPAQAEKRKSWFARRFSKHG